MVQKVGIQIGHGIKYDTCCFNERPWWYQIWELDVSAVAWSAPPFARQTAPATAATSCGLFHPLLVLLRCLPLSIVLCTQEARTWPAHSKDAQAGTWNGTLHVY